MRKTLISIAIAISSAAVQAEPAPVAPPARESFKLEGYTYVYEVKADEKRRVITGIRYPDKTPFSFTVKGGFVEGVSNGQPVTFSLAEAKGAAKGAVAE